MAGLKEKIANIRKLRKEREDCDERLYISKLELYKTEDLLRRLRKGETAPRIRTEIELEEDRKKLKDEYDRAKQEIAVCYDNVQKEIEGIYGNQHPREVITELDDSIPFLLMPLRIETRFISAGTDTELWLRIYPDDIAVHTHEKLLTDKEVPEGIKYWKELFRAEKTGGSPEEIEDRKKSAWSNIASLFGPQRSAWIAKQTRPANWSSDLSGIESEDQLSFPVHDQTKTNAWSRAPRTKILPDKFVVMLYQGEELVHEAVGNVIPDELFLGPDPLEAEAAFENKNDKLLFGESFDWASDFDKAVQSGMGFKIKLTPGQAASGLDRILVLGTYLSADETDGKQALEELIDNHHYSPKGFSLVLQGTPTNNTDQDGSGYAKNDQFNAIGYYVETGGPLFTADRDCDGRNLADALGIEYEPLQYVQNSESSDYRHAVLMNKALYPATLGYFIETLLHPVLSAEAQDAIRQLFTDHVTGRGPLPAIRVGNQPYGVLLTSDFGKWRWNKMETFFSASFLNTVYAVLLQYQNAWDGLLKELMYVGKEGKDPSEVLMNILGLQAGSVSFYQRTGYSTDYLKNLDEFQYGGTYWSDTAKNFSQKNVLLNFFKGFGYDAKDEAGLLKVPQALRLVYQHYNTLLDAANLVDNAPLSEKDAIRWYDEAHKKNYLHWLAEASSIEALERQDFGAGKTAPNALLYMKARRALLLQLHKASAGWFKKHDIELDSTLRAANFHNIRPQGDLTKYEVMKAKVGVAAPEHPQKALAVSDYLLTTGTDEDEARFLNEMRVSLKILADVSTAKLERCFTEHMDACTYRLDAWQTALFRLRLLKQRTVSGPGSGQGRRTGVYIGAYGWVENIRPSGRQPAVTDTIPARLRPPGNEPLYEYADNEGFVHAPSLNHASAAAILRSGYLSHAGADKPDMMAVNLSSERVRRALFVLQGMRKGQPLEALLGYQFERGLHDRASANDALKKLNLYIYDFRDKFPYQQHRIGQQGSPAGPTESLPAGAVVNGIALAETTSTFPYGVTGAITEANAFERTATEQEKDKLSDTLDAIKDLLLAESAYQMVQGNFDRAGSILNALKDAHIPPELDVINTPRSSHFTFTNRVTLQFENADPGLAANNPWAPPVPMTPRAKLEPGLNKWLGAVLGKPADIVYRVAHPDAEGNEIGSSDMTLENLVEVHALQPIDLVYISGNELNTGAQEEDREARTGASELESRIAYHYRQVNALDDEAVIQIEFTKPETAGKKTFAQLLPLLRMLKSVITDARHLHAQDFDPPSKTGFTDKDNPRGYDPADLQGRIETAAALFESYLSDMDGIAIDATVTNLAGESHTYTALKDTFAAMDEAAAGFEDITYAFSSADAAELQNALVRIAGFGVHDAFPKLTSLLTEKNKMILLEQARSVARRAGEALAKSTALLAQAAAAADVQQKIETYREAGKAVMGEVFNIIPLFTYNNEPDIQQSNADRPQLFKHAKKLKMIFPADEWLQNVSHVRPKPARWDYIRTLSEAFNNTSLDLKPVQLPYRAKDSWLAVEFPETDEITGEPFTIAHDTLSITIHGDAAFAPGAKQCGLLIDDWTEVIPTGQEITGIAFNYNQPNACPPQALLLAVTPEEKGHWTWDDLVGILNDTLQRAKRRAVEPIMLDKVNRPELAVLLPTMVADFSQHDLNLSLDYRLNVQYFTEAAPVLPADGTS